MSSRLLIEYAFPNKYGFNAAQNSMAGFVQNSWRAPRLLKTVLVAVAVLSITVSSAAQQKKKSGESGRAAALAFAQATELLHRGSLDEALSTVQRGLAQSPTSVAGLNLLGMIYHQQRRYPEAVAALQKALEIEPGSLKTLNNLAISYTAEQQLDLAEETLQMVVRLQPTSATANYNLGIILLSRHKPKVAIAALQRVHPTDGSTLLNLAQGYFMAGMIPEGLQTATTLSRRAGKDVSLHYSLGVVLASRKQWQPAIREFEIANVLHPGTVEILHNLGQAYLHASQPAKAQAVLAQALTVDPASAEVLYLLAQAQANQQRDVEALELLVHARKLAPENTDVLLLMARISMKQAFYEDAIALLTDAIKAAPKRSELHAALGESYFTTGKTEEALKEFRTVLELDPSPSSYAFMGLCYRHLGNFDQAKQYLQTGLKADPNNIPSLFNLGYIAKRQENFVEGERYLRKALRLDPDYADALFELGSLMLEEKKYSEAIPLLRHCAAINATPAQAYYKLASAERNFHQMEAAQRDMNIFITLSKNPQRGPYPRQNIFEQIDRREGFSTEEKNQASLHELELGARNHPDNPRSLSLLAEANLKLNRVDEAMRVMERLDTLSARDFRTLIGEGVLLASFHLYPAAILHFQEALSANPDSEEARYDLGNAYFQNHDDNLALQVLLGATEAKHDTEYLALLGDVNARLGNSEDAIDALRKAILASPDNDEYYLSLSLTQLKTNHVGDAYATLQRGLTLVPDSGILHWGAGLTFVLQGDAKQAEAYLKKAVELAPSRESVLMALGIFYYEAGRIGEAREVLNRCREQFPDGIDLSGVGAILDAASAQTAQVADLSLHSRQEFYNLALKVAEQDR
jgi:tetratricopeptide (TPR) repeat protein